MKNTMTSINNRKRPQAVAITRAAPDKATTLLFVTLASVCIALGISLVLRGLA